MKNSFFIETTRNNFSDLDDLLINFLNELDPDSRKLVYKKLILVDDETIDNYHTLVKLVLEATEADPETEESLWEVKRLIKDYQELLKNIILLVTEISHQLSDELFFESADSLAKELQAYII